MMTSGKHGARRYVLLMNDGARKEFSAENPAQALKLAQGFLPHGRAAELIEDGVSLAEVSYSEAGFWSVSKTTGGPS